MKEQSQQQTQPTPEELFQALKVVGKFAEESNGYFEVWDDNEVILRNAKGDDSLVYLELNEETPESMMEQLKPHQK